MLPIPCSAPAVRWSFSVLAAGALAVLPHGAIGQAPSSSLAVPSNGSASVPDAAPKQVVKLPVKPGAVEVAFTDGSHLKMLVSDEKITLITPHGKLLIAVKDIHRIEFAWRLADEDSRRIAAAVANLGSPEFRQREADSGAKVEALHNGERRHGSQQPASYPDATLESPACAAGCGQPDWPAG